MKSETFKWLVLLLTLILEAGCASSGPPLPPSLELPRPVGDLRALRKGDKVYLAWTVPEETTDREAVRHPGSVLICRSQDTPMKECGSPAGKVPAGSNLSPKQAPMETTASYTDSLPMAPGVNPEDEITYAVEVLNNAGRSAGLSNQVRVPLLPAVSPPDKFEAEITAQGVRITWSCPLAFPPKTDHVAYRLRILRRQEGSQTDDPVAQPDLADCQGPPNFDTSFLWEKTYSYRAAVITVVSPPGKPVLEIEGDDTASVSVFAHDVFPPTVPSALQAVFSGPGQPPFIDLIWSPDTEADLAGYNLYRRIEGEAPVRLNTTLVKESAYRDRNVQSGIKYFYSVTAVDTHGNESEKSEEANESVP